MRLSKTLLNKLDKIQNKLSKKEIEILSYMIQDINNNEIASLDNIYKSIDILDKYKIDTTELDYYIEQAEIVGGIENEILTELDNNFKEILKEWLNNTGF